MFFNYHQVLHYLYHILISVPHETVNTTRNVLSASPLLFLLMKKNPLLTIRFKKSPNHSEGG